MTRYAVAILLALTMPASAQQDTANQILPGCKGYVDRDSRPTTTLNGAWAGGICAGFVAGVGWAGSSIVCFPAGVTTRQAVGRRH
jgi:hypothetical protein